MVVISAGQWFWWFVWQTGGSGALVVVWLTTMVLVVVQKTACWGSVNWLPKRLRWCSGLCDRLQWFCGKLPLVSQVCLYSGRVDGCVADCGGSVDG